MKALVKTGPVKGAELLEVEVPAIGDNDLLVKVQAADHVDAEALIRQVEERAAMAEAKIDLFRRILRKMRGDLGEEEFLRVGRRIGPYLTCLRGLAFEEGNRDWCRRTAAILRARNAAVAGEDTPAVAGEGAAPASRRPEVARADR